MTRKIPTKDLKLGMFVVDVGRSWLNHPWMTKTKTITSISDIKELLEHGITEVIVDLSKSVKIETKENLVNPSKEIPSKINKAPVIIKKLETASSSLEEEMPQAVKTYKSGLDTSKALWAACRMNQKIEVEVVKENVDAMINSVKRDKDALMALIKLRRFDDYTFTHSLNVSVLAISMAKSLGLDDKQLQIIGVGAMFHDVGKSRVPAHILNKPKMLTDAEFVVMKKHAQFGVDIIAEQKLKLPDEVIKVVGDHHEKYDGSGYGKSLQGDDILDLAVICSLSDVYDALTSDRVYHKGKVPPDAIKIIYTMRDANFKAYWVDKFVQCVGIYPPGTIVELNTTEVAIVVKVDQNNLTKPVIKIVSDPSGYLMAHGKTVDLAKTEIDYTIEKILTKDEAGFDAASYLNVDSFL